MDSKDFLDQIASVKQQVKETEDIKKPKSSSSTGRNVDVKELQYEIKDDDKELVVLVKDMINKAHITNKHVYDTVGRAYGWNLIYGLNKGVSWDRVKEWAEITGNEIELTIIKK